MLYRFAAILVLVVGCASAGKDRRGANVDGGGITVTDSSFGTTDTTPFPDAASGCVTQMRDLLANGNFDGAPLAMGWTQSDSSIVTAADGVPEQSAPNKAWLGGVVAPITTISDQLYQDVAVPAGTTSLTLTGFYDVRTGEAASDPAYDTATAELVTTGGTPIEAIDTYDNTKPQTAWVPINHSFTANVSGQTVRLRFSSTNDYLNATSFYFDTLALTATFCQ